MLQTYEKTNEIGTSRRIFALKNERQKLWKKLLGIS